MLQFNAKKVFIGAIGKKANRFGGNDILANGRRMAKQEMGIRHRMWYSSGASVNLITPGIFSVGAAVVTCPIAMAKFLITTA